MKSITFNRADEENHFPALINAVSQYLDFKKWGFSYKIYHATNKQPPRIIFQSTLCKIKVHTFRDIRESTPEVIFSYGRTHAPHDKGSIIWNNEKCRCWHSVNNALNFLDCTTPQEVSENSNTHKLIRDFYVANKNKGWTTADFVVQAHAIIWDNYGENLFTLFDLRRPDLWQKYSLYCNQINDMWNKRLGYTAIPHFKLC